MSQWFYQDDLVTLYRGDNLTELSWLDADVLVTDPPYGRNWKQGDTEEARGWKSNARKAIAGDESTEARDAVLALWGDRPAIVFGDLTLPPPPGVKSTLVYAKPADAGVRGAIGGYRRDVEAIYLLGKGWGSGTGGRTSVIRTRNTATAGTSGIAKCAGGHPHSKPLDVLAELLLHAPAGIVADPFAGGGSTLVAAKMAGRESVGVEIEHKWCTVAARRLAQDCLPMDMS